MPKTEGTAVLFQVIRDARTYFLQITMGDDLDEYEVELLQQLEDALSLEMDQ